MNLAVQTISASVADSLEFLIKDDCNQHFAEAGATIEFIKIKLLFCSQKLQKSIWQGLWDTNENGNWTCMETLAWRGCWIFVILKRCGSIKK